MQDQHDEDAKNIAPEFIHHNLKHVDVARTLLSIIAGIYAGILRCESLSGLICFIVLYTIIALSLAFKMKFDVKMYTNSSFIVFAAGDLQKNGLSFILFWTLTYALVYIY